MKFKTSIIIKEATEIKSFIEKYKRIPKSCTIYNTTLSPYSAAYLLSKIIKDNFENNEVNLVDVIGYNSEKVKDSINEKVYKQDYLDMVNRFVKYCVDHKRVPAYVTTKSSRKKVSFELYMYGVSKIVNFYKENKVLPNYCIFNKSDLLNTNTSSTTIKKEVKKATSTNSNIYISSPHYTKRGCNNLGQCTSYWCGPHSIHQAIRKFNITKYSEKQIASYAGSTKNGTSHSGINTAIAKISKDTKTKLNVSWKNFSDMGKNDAERFKAVGKLLANPNKAIIWHILYVSGGSSITGTGYGHYEYVDKINDSTKYVRALNSLGDKKADGSYTGKLQDRKYSVQSYYARNTPGNQSALCIITKG